MRGERACDSVSAGQGYLCSGRSGYPITTPSDASQATLPVDRVTCDYERHKCDVRDGRQHSSCLDCWKGNLFCVC